MQPICTPTRSTLLSGRYQIHTGLQHDIIQNGQDNAVDPEGRMELLPEAMRRAGLGTHMVGKWHAGFARESYCPWRRGFDTFVGYLSGCEDYYHKTAGGALDWWNGSQPAFFAPPEECPYWPGAPLAPNASARPECLGNYSADVYVREAQRHIAAHAEGGARASERMFLYLAMQSVHWPMEAPAWALRSVDPSLRDPWRRYYAAMAIAADAAVGQVVQALRAAGMWDDTLLVLSSDNGGMSGGYNGANSTCGGLNYPYRGWKDSLWEGGSRAVGMAKLPRAARVADSKPLRGLFHVSDFLPTLFAAVGGDVATLQPDIDGVDQYPALLRAAGLAPADATLGDTDEAARTARDELLHNIDPLSYPVRAALRVGDLKVVIEGAGRPTWGWCDINATEGGGLTNPCPLDLLLVTRGDEGELEARASRARAVANEVGWSGGGTPMLFNISTDPRETDDLAGDPAWEPQLRALLERLTWHNSTAVPCRYPPVEPTFDPLATGVLGPFLPDVDAAGDAGDADDALGRPPTTTWPLASVVVSRGGSGAARSEAGGPPAAAGGAAAAAAAATE